MYALLLGRQEVGGTGVGGVIGTESEAMRLQSKGGDLSTDAESVSGCAQLAGTGPRVAYNASFLIARDLYKREEMSERGLKKPVMAGLSCALRAMPCRTSISRLSRYSSAILMV